MDLASMIPILGIAVGVPGLVTFVAVLAGHTRKMKELAIKEREVAVAEADASLLPEVDALRDELTDTRAQLAELQERVAFAERLLTAGSPPGK